MATIETFLSNNNHITPIGDIITLNTGEFGEHAHRVRQAVVRVAREGQPDTRGLLVEQSGETIFLETI